MARVSRHRPSSSSQQPTEVYTKKLQGLPPPNILAQHPILDAYSTNKKTLDLDNLFDSEPDITFLNSPAPFPRATSEDKDAQTRPVIPEKDKHKYVLLKKRVVHQSGKGKISSQYAGVVVGNGNGIVGFGDAKSDAFPAAMIKAEANAIKNCDYVDLFEGRTIWTNMSVKFGSTKLELRPRPRGFGLMCNPFVHQVRLRLRHVFSRGTDRLRLV